jgi:hypothetical protein
MEHLAEITFSVVNTVFDHANMFLSSLSGGEFLTQAGSSLTVAMAAGAVTYGNLTDGILYSVRRWHGGIDEQFAAINNLLDIVNEHQPTWAMPVDLYMQLIDNQNNLNVLIARCRTNLASRADREQRNTLLKSTVGLCLMQVRIWAYGRYSEGVMTADDVHLIGFLLPGETGGHHDRTETTDVKAEVKVTVLNEDVINAVIDQSAGENAAQVEHGWPPGIRLAMIVITAADGETEIFRIITTRLHNKIHMPEGSHGKQFIIKASFLKHVNDEPLFGNEPTFSMPLTTEDLAAAVKRQTNEELERQRQEIERLNAELNAQKNSKK